MEIIDSTASAITVVPVHYAGFLLRFVAYIIDRIVLGIIFFVTVVPVMAIFGMSLWSMRGALSNMENMSDETTMALVIGMIGIYSSFIFTATIFNWLYYALMESSRHQATLGKLAVGIKVTDMDGNRISFLNATGRYFGKIISGMIFMIGYIMIIFTAKKQGLHDIMAGTLVVRKG